MRNMRIVIVGGGKVGRYLASSLLERKNTISIIEKNRNHCQSLANMVDAEVILEMAPAADLGRSREHAI